MKKHMLIGLVLVCLAWLSFTGTAQAQRGRGGQRGGGSRGYSTPFYGGYNQPYYGGGYYQPYSYGGEYNRPYFRGYYDNSYYSGPTYQVIPETGYTQAAPTTTYQSFYSGPPADKVRLHVIVPTPDSQLRIEGNATQQTGTERVFDSPSLEPGKTFTYTLKATWREGDREVNKEKQVKVMAGQESTVRFD